MHAGAEEMKATMNVYCEVLAMKETDLSDHDLDRWWAALMRRLGRGIPISRQEATMTLAECEKALEKISEAEAPPLTEEEIDRIIERVTGEK